MLTDLRIREVIIIDGDDYGQTKVEQIRHIMRARLKFIAEIKVITAKASGRFTTSGNQSR